MKLRALVFEDNDILCTTFSRILNNRGYEVFAFPDPSFCPLTHEPHCPCPGKLVCADIIITDIQMPHITGIEFVEKLFKMGCKLPFSNIALFSGAWSHSNLEYAKSFGCTTFSKPFDLDEINVWIAGCKKSIDPKRILFNWSKDKP